MRMLAATGIALAQLVLGQEIQTVQVTSGIPGPTDIQNAGDGSGRLFLVQQNGIVRILRNGTLAPQPFLDISGKTSAGRTPRSPPAR